MVKPSDKQKKTVIWSAIILAIVACFSAAVVQFGWDWIGLTSYTTTKTDANENIIEIENHRGKTLWDFLELIIIPVALGLGAFLLNKAQSKNEQLIASNEQQEVLLQNYIDAITALILEKELCEKEDSVLRNLARARTLTVLRALNIPNPDGNNRRKASLIRFLYEMKLIIGDNPVINLRKASLEVAYMRKYDLSGANLQEVSLYRADLRGADLTGANLKNAYLVEAKLQGADLSGAKNLGEATLDNSYYGSYVNGETKWPKGFTGWKKAIKKDLDKSRDFSIQSKT